MVRPAASIPLHPIWSVVPLITSATVPGLPPDGRKASLINFSADGECVSVSFGDESVSLYAIRYDETELDQEKIRLEESIYVGKDHALVLFVFSICTIIAWFWIHTNIV